MLFKNNMRPAFATAGATDRTGSHLSKIKDFFTRSEQSADDDFNAFGSTSDKQQRSAPPRQERPQQPKRPPQKRKKPSSPIQWRPILTIAAAVAAVILLITIIVVIICAAPAKNIEAEDNIFTVVLDEKNNYRIVSNGELLDEEFKADSVKIIPADNYAFAYVEVAVSTGKNPGIEMYILEDNELEKVPHVAIEIYAYAAYEPGIVFKDKDFFRHYTPDEDSTIAPAPLEGTSIINTDSFCISGNANAVAFTTLTADGIHSSLNYFVDGLSDEVTIGKQALLDFTPLKLSIDGSYIYGVKSSKFDEDNVPAEQSLSYIFTEDEGESFTGGNIVSMSKYGTLVQKKNNETNKAIAGSVELYTNVDGDEIVFVTEKASEELDDESAGASSVSTYMCQIESKSLELLCKGSYRPVFINKAVVCPETFIDTFFECETTKQAVDAEGEPITQQVQATYFIKKGDGVKLVAEALGKFSPDGDYFYFLDVSSTANSKTESKNLKRVPLDSDDFVKDAELVVNYVNNFHIIENGDIYLFTQGNDNRGYITYYDSSTGKRPIVDSNIDFDSIAPCADSVFYTKTDDKGTKTTYISTENSTPEVVDFDSVTPSQAPVVLSGYGDNAYILLRDKSNKDYLFYTSNGTKFSDVMDGSCKILGFTEVAPPATNKDEQKEENTDNKNNDNKNNAAAG